MTSSHRTLGPWTTSLDNNSRLGLTTFWRRRMQAIAALPLTPRRTARRTLGGAVLAAALLAATPLVDFAPAAAAEGEQGAAAPAAAIDPAADKGKFVVQFTNGVELELIGVSEFPSTANSWRSPDGAPLAAPYKPNQAQRNVWESPMLREFCWRWRGADDPDIDTSWDVEEETNGWGPVTPRGPDGHVIKDLTAYVVPFKIIRPTCTLRFTMSYPGSKWQTYWQGQAGNFMSMGNRDGTGIVFDKPRAMDGGAFVVMGYAFPQDHEARLIAVDGAGKRHVGKSEGGAGMLGYRQLAAQFPDLQPQNIRTWIVERRTRLSESVEFRNVSLDPNTPSIVNIIGRLAEQRGDDAGAGQPVEPTGFDPEIEGVLHKDPRSDEGLVDLDAGKAFKLDDSYAEDSAPKWLEDHGIDVAADLHSSESVSLLGFDLIAVPTETENWDRADKLTEHLRGASPMTPAVLDAGGQLPATFFFQTREGARGVLQITKVVPGTTVTIRYKLAK